MALEAFEAVLFEALLTSENDQDLTVAVIPKLAYFGI